MRARTPARMNMLFVVMNKRNSDAQLVSHMKHFRLIFLTKIDLNIGGKRTCQDYVYVK